MGFEYMGPLPDPDTRKQITPSSSEPSQPQQAPQASPSYGQHTGHAMPEMPYEPAYREHTGPLQAYSPTVPYIPPAHPQQAMPPGYGQPLMPPTYQQQPVPPGYYPPAGYVGYPYAAYPGYPGYAPYPYYWQAPPQKPKRDGYEFGIAIASFVGAILVLLGGLASFLILLLSVFAYSSGVSTSPLPQSQIFSSYTLFTALGIAGVVGGAFGLYHSIRALFLQKPSADFKLPRFWIFLALYIAVLIIAGVLFANGQSVSNPLLTIFLIALAGIFPAVTILSLALRRLRFPHSEHWPTTWRRFTFALVSGATQAIVLASIFELILTFVVAAGLGVTSSAFAIDNPNFQMPTDPRAISFIFLLVSVIAPLVEEAVKPLAVVIFIGRMRSAAEAFILGMSCGIGFDLIETSGYISMGYKDWLNVALQRSTAGLLHGLGAGMVALGWYYLTHPKASKHRFLLAFGCWLYAVLQHAIWNGSFGLALLPAPIGAYFDTGTIPFGSLQIPSVILVYIAESVLMLVFLFYVTRKLRPSSDMPPAKPETGTPANAPRPFPVQQQAGLHA